MNMHKMDVSGSAYSINSRRPFSPVAVDSGLIDRVTDFAWEMCFGQGHHRHHRTGGMLMRRSGERFCNTFQGKLAEVCLRGLLLQNGVICGAPDFDVYGEGVWDDFDLEAGGKSVSVKSAAFFSNLLLLETHDYDRSGNYLPNLMKGATAGCDFIALLRISPDIKTLFRNARLLYRDDVPRADVERIVAGGMWQYDVAGWISHGEFVDAISGGFVIPRGALLNGRIPMDADNYYIQAGDMHGIGSLYSLLVS